MVVEDGVLPARVQNLQGEPRGGMVRVVVVGERPVDEEGDEVRRVKLATEGGSKPASAPEGESKPGPEGERKPPPLPLRAGPEGAPPLELGLLELHYQTYHRPRQGLLFSELAAASEGQSKTAPPLELPSAHMVICLPQRNWVRDLE